MRNIGVADGIDAARLLLPRCWFDEEKCRVGLEALTFYRKDYNERLQMFTDKPLHDWVKPRGGCVSRLGGTAHAAETQAGGRAAVSPGGGVVVAIGSVAMERRDEPLVTLPGSGPCNGYHRVQRIVHVYGDDPTLP